MDKRIFLIAPRQLEVDRSASWLRLFGECFPNRRNHAQKLGFIELEGEVARRYPHNVCGLEHRLEPNSFLANVFPIACFPRLGASTDRTDSLDIFCGETDFIAIDAKAARLVGEAQSWPRAIVGIIIGILDEFEQEVCRFLV